MHVVNVCCKSGIVCCSIRDTVLKSTHHHVILPASCGNKMLLTHCSHSTKLFSLMSTLHPVLNILLISCAQWMVPAQRIPTFL